MRCRPIYPAPDEAVAASLARNDGLAQSRIGRVRMACQGSHTNLWVVQSGPVTSEGSDKLSGLNAAAF
jgi:hypothetical protein